MNSPKLDLSQYRIDDQVVANFVATGFGEYKDESGSSRGISNAIDRKVLVHLRSLTQAVLVGGETARVESYKADSRFATYVLTRKPDELPEGLNAVTATSDEELSKSITQLVTNHGGLLIEAGPTLLKRMMKLALVDLLCLSVIEPKDDLTGLLKSLFDIDTAQLVSSQKIENTLLTIWKL